MSEGKAPEKRPSRWKLSPRAVSLIIALSSFVAVVVVQRLGLLQFLEFQAYDFFIRHQKKAPTSGPIVLIEMTESDIQSPSLDYPIHDDKLAELLEAIEAQEPANLSS